MPINYVTSPGVALSAACFSDNRFVDGPAQKCFSNLLAIGFRRFVLDLYWDTSRLTWSLCPVELGNSEAATSSSVSRNTSTTLSTSSSSTSAAATLSYATLSPTNQRRDTVRTVLPEELYNSAPNMQPRQADSPLSSAEPSATSTSPTATTVSDSDSSDAPTSVPGSGGTLYKIGPYTCSSTLGLSNITDVLAGHLKETENSLNATLKYLILNLHSAATDDDPVGIAPTPEGSLLPSTGNYLGELINSSLSSYIYTPVALEGERADLNSTWFTVSSDYQPLDGYLAFETTTAGVLETANGWPNEGFIELQKAMRFLAAFGTIFPQIQGYNFTADAGTIFAPEYISNVENVILSSAGVVTSGCLWESNSTSSSTVNASWAISSSTYNASDFDTAVVAVSNLTACGISPILNATLGDTADNNITLYIEYIHHDIWSWAYNEPRDNDRTSTDLHCAALNLTNHGQWQVEDCGNSHYGVCRANSSEPYRWTVTTQSGAYDKMEDACQSQDYVFSVPRTALENTYLREAIQAWILKNDDDDGSYLFWINFNDADVTGCWVDGVNSTCPYHETKTNSSREVVVPTVAGVIVFVIAIVIIFVKCAGNRQNAKTRRRRGDGGWDYEGVPS